MRNKIKEYQYSCPETKVAGLFEEELDGIKSQRLSEDLLISRGNVCLYSYQLRNSLSLSQRKSVE